MRVLDLVQEKEKKKNKIFKRYESSASKVCSLGINVSVLSSFGILPQRYTFLSDFDSAAF